MPAPKDERAQLFTAVMTGPRKLTESFLRAALKEDPSIADWRDPHYHGRTPLILAAWVGRTELVKVLLESGTDPNQKDDDGSTALMMAAILGHDDCATALLDGGADINQTSPDGLTATDCAGIGQRKKTVKLLSARGGTPGI